MIEQTSRAYEAVNAYKEGLGWLQTKLPNVGDHFIGFSQVCFEQGAVSEKDKHLMALAIGIHAQDEYCIQYHGTRALELGTTEQELLETIGVCAAFGGGAGLAQGITLVRDMIEHRSSRNTSEPQTSHQVRLQ